MAIDHYVFTQLMVPESADVYESLMSQNYVHILGKFIISRESLVGVGSRGLFINTSLIET